MKSISILTLAVLFGAAATPCSATVVTYGIFADGAQEVGGGDVDGSAIGTIDLDDVAGTATINLTLADIDLTTLSGHHIHNAPVGVNGSIVLDFGDPDTIRTGSVLSGTIGGLLTATITSIHAAPSNFYYNLHNGAFPGGAVRDQLTAVPEASSLLCLGIVSLSGAVISACRKLRPKAG
jgi:hypothetical protein